jgi:alpha-L-rhamnosidase
MNSLNHYAYGAIGDWLYKVVAGINIDRATPGYKRILFRPQPGGGLTNAKATLDTQYGKVSSAWTLGNQFTYRIEVPANTTAVVTLPGAGSASVLVNKKALVNNALITNISKQENDLQFEVGSGIYEFVYAK